MVYSDSGTETFHQWAVFPPASQTIMCLFSLETQECYNTCYNTYSCSQLTKIMGNESGGEQNPDLSLA